MLKLTWKMRWFSSFWRNVTQNGLDQSTGKLEAAFFESLYRITYASGLSLFTQESTRMYRCYCVLIKICIIVFISSELWCLFSQSSDLDTLVENINVTIIHLIVYYRHKCLSINKEVFKKLTKSMESPNFDVSSPSRQKVLKFWIRRHEQYFKMLLILACSTLSVWYVYPLLDDVDYNYMVRLPLNFRSPKIYAVTYVIVLMMFHFISFFVVVNDLTMQAYLMHMACQFDVLCDCFENIQRDCSKGFKGQNMSKLHLNIRFQQQYFERLGNLVEQHQFLLRNASDMRRVLSSPMLGQLAASGMLICFVGYQFIIITTFQKLAAASVAKFVMTLLYLSYNFFLLFLLCRWCDEIKLKSEQIGLSVYRSGWQRGIASLPDVRTSLALVMLRASRPVVLTAGSVYDLSLTSYTTLIKTSYSALTVLLQARHRG